MSKVENINVGDLVKITRYGGKEVCTIASVSLVLDKGDLFAEHVGGDWLVSPFEGREYYLDNLFDEYVVIAKEEADELTQPDADKQSDTDTVNSPAHYTNAKFETIEIIEEITQGYEDGYVAYLVGNTLKYLARAPYKHEEPTEDLRKAAKYVAFAIEHLTKELSKEDE